MQTFNDKLNNHLSSIQCYNLDVHQKYLKTGIPSEDCILQNSNELMNFCQWIYANNIRSYLEIGIWTGGLLRFMSNLFQFEKVAACDILGAKKYGLNISIPSDVDFFLGSSNSEEYLDWRSGLGHIDLVFIDADHQYSSIKNDFLINKRFSQKYIALHDITGSNENTQGVKRFWDELSYGNKSEIICPHNDITDPSALMGIGIWSK